MREICQSRLAYAPWMNPRTSRLPGLNAMDPSDWLQIDEVYGAQMAYREKLISQIPQTVHALDDSARDAAEELLEALLAVLADRPDFDVSPTVVACPDGRSVTLDRTQPLLTMGRLVQEDFNIMQKRGREHVLTGSILCFPSSWSLDQKFLKPLVAIHVPVPRYDDDVAVRVQRLFDMIKVGRPMWRANTLVYSNPDLHQPRREDNRRELASDSELWLRSERQTLTRMPQSDAVVFSIHNTVVRFENLTQEQRDTVKVAVPEVN